MKNYIQAGNTISYAPAAAVNSGDGMLLGASGLFGIAANSVAANEEGEFDIVGVFELTKNTADTPAAFSPAYWDDGNSRVTTTSTDNTLIGFFMKAYTGTDSVAHVRLTPAVA